MSPDLVAVELRQVPLDVWKRAAAHQEAIQREFDILRVDLGTDSVPHQLSELVAKLNLTFGDSGDPSREEVHAAAERGVPEIDLVYRVPAEAATAVQDLEVMLERVDEFCRAGERLLTLSTPPDLLTFRRWFLGEFSRQIEHGLPPTSWPDFQSPSEPGADVTRAVDEGVGATAEPIVFHGDLDLATAGSLREQILTATASGAKRVVIDLASVGFMDSVGLSLLVSAHNRMVDDGGEMRLILPTHLRPLLEIAGLLDLLQPEFVDEVL